MKPWIDLYSQHRSLREQQGSSPAEVRDVLERLAQQVPSIVDRSPGSRLVRRTSKETKLDTFEFQQHGHELLALWALTDEVRRKVHLEDARLTVMFLMDKAHHLHQFTVMVEGKRIDDGSEWAIAVHLEDDHPGPKGEYDRKGSGACGHAALHCHAGPTLSDHPKVRVPFPPMPPAAIVEWVISQVIPHKAYDAAPWPRVLAALQKDA